MNPIEHAVLLVALATALPAQSAVVVEAAHLVVAPKTILHGDDAKLAIRGGEVAGVGREIPRELLESAARLRFPGATIVPGFVVAHDQLELAADLAETISAFTPALRAADAFDPFDEALGRHARGGVTSVGLAPSSANVVGGLGAAVRWRPGGGEVLDDTTYLKAALVGEALDQDRYPTSRMGAADLLRSELAGAAAPLGPVTREQRTIAGVLAGGLRLAVHARTCAEITEALALCAEFDLRPIVVGADEAAECVDRLRAAGASVALAPLELDSEPARLGLPAALERAGVELSFFAASPERLRRSVALAVRHGLSREGALAALTTVPAAQLGQAERIGSLRRGCSADFAVFDGDPIDLTSKLEAVFVAGERVRPEEDQR